MAISARFQADFSNFVAAVDKAETKLRDFQSGSVSVEKSLTRLGDSFSGRKVLQEATLASKAVNDIGGVTKLTEAEQRRLNTTVTEALAKYKALGIAAPQNLKDIEKATRNSEQAMAAMADRASKLGRGLTTVGTGLTAALTVPLAAIGGVAIKSAIDFETSFAGVRKTVNATEAEFAELSTGFREMAKEIPVNVNELNKIGEAAGQLGIQTENILGFTRVMADLGVTTNLSSDQAATALARLANITQMPQSEFDKLGSTIVALGNNLATTEAEIVEFGLRVAGAGAQIGLSEAQILSIGAALSSVGINAEAGGTAISKVMIDIAASVDKGGERLGMFAAVAGVSAKEFKTQFETNAAGALTAFIAGLGNMEKSGKSTLGVLEEMGISEVRMRDALLRASGAGDLLARSIDLGTKAWGENNALTKEAEQRYGTTASQLTLMLNNLRDVAITLGNALLPFMKAAIDRFKEWIPVIEGVAKWFGDLSPRMQTLVLVLGGVAAAIGPVLVVFGSMAYAVSTLIPLLPALGAAFAVLTGPIGLVVAAIVGLTAAWYVFGDDITTAVTGAYNAVKTWLWDKLGPVLAPIGGLLQSVGQMFLALGELVGAVVEMVLGKVGGFVAGVASWLGIAPVMRAVMDLFQSIVSVVAGVTTSVIGFVRQMYDGIKEWLFDKFTSIVAGIKDKIDAITGFFRSMKDAVVGHSYVPDMVAAIGREMARLQSLMVTPAKTATDATKQMFNALNKAVQEFSGTEAITAALAYAAAVQKVGGAAKLTAADQGRVNQAMVVAIERYQILGREAPQALIDLEAQTRALLTTTREWTSVLSGSVATIQSSGASLDAYNVVAEHGIDALFRHGEATKASNAELERMGILMPNLAITTESVAREMDRATTMTIDWRDGLGELSKGFSQLGQIAGDSLSGIVRGIGSVISSISLSLGGLDAFKKGWSQITAAGAGIGGLLSGIAGIASGIGAIIPIADLAWKGIKKLFGGASEAEREGRSAAADFRNELASLLTETQRIEAGNDEWKKSVIAVRDAYLAAGKTEQEALAIMDALWKAEKAGGQGVAAVIREIETVMRSGVIPAVTALGDTGTGVFSDLTNSSQRFREDLGQPIAIDVQLNLDQALRDLDQLRSAGASWQSGQSSKSSAELLEDFLRRNPGDVDRAAAAILDEHRKTDALVNIPGMHTGGLVDFAKWQRAHSGLKVDEVPIIAQTGEGILSRRGMAALDKLNSGGGLGGGDTRPIVIHVTSEIDGRVAARAVAEYLPGILATMGVRVA